MSYLNLKTICSLEADEIAYPVLCAKKRVSSACSRTTSEMISLSIERLFNIPCYDGHQSLPTPSTFISLHFCATSLGLLLAIMYLFSSSCTANK